MDFEFNYINERDADFAIINAFLRSEKVRKLFSDVMGEIVEEILKVFHSLKQREEGYGLGESDILIIFRNGKKKIGLFIEDKIHADPQPNQRERYDVRAKELKDKNMFDKHFVFLCAPELYIQSPQGKDYKKHVSYESIINVLNEGFDKAVLERALKGDGFIIKDDDVTKFWFNLYAYVFDNYKNIELAGRPRDKSYKSLWPTFRTNLPGSTVILKSEQGVIDLEFPNMGDRLEEVKATLKSINVDGNVVKTGNSASLRIEYDVKNRLNFQKDFYSQISNVNKWLDAAVYLTEIADKINEKKNS